MEKKRIEYLDSLKGFGIILVIINHILPSGHPIIKWMSDFHMPLFFVISGILLCYSSTLKNSCNTQFIIKKFKDLILTYLKYMFVLIIFIFFLNYICNINYLYIIPNIIKQTIFLEGYGPLWFIFCLFFAECLFKILNNLTKNNHYTLLICIIISILIYQIDIHYYMNSASLIIRYLSTLLFVSLRSICACAFVSIGYEIAPYINKLSKNKGALFTSVLIVLLSIVFISKETIIFSNIDYGHLIIFYVKASIIVLAYITIFSSITNRTFNNVLSFYGKNTSFILYTHESFFIVELFKNILSDFNIIYTILAVILIETLLILIKEKLLQIKPEIRNS